MRSEFANTVLHYLGLVLLIVGLLILVPIIPAYFYGEATIIPFLISSVISLVWGVILFKWFKKGKLSLGRAMVFAALAFALMALIGSAPYYMLAEQIYGGVGANAYVSSYFESMSGFTTTGLSTLPDIEALPMSLLFWRSMTQWIGGIGIVVLFLTVLIGPGLSASYLFRGEAREEKLEPSIRHTVRGMAKIYGLYTLIGVAILYVLGLPIFDAVTHIFTAVSTGGFSINTASIGAYGNPLLEVAMLFLMTIGATSFLLHYKLLGWKWKELKGFLKSREMMIFIWIMVIFTCILALYFYLTGDSSPLRHGAFQVVSASTTTGYTNMNIVGSSDFVKIMLIMLMFIGGSAGSTAGGLKIIRLLILLESIPWLVKKYLLPKTAVFPLKFGKRVFKDEEVVQVTTYLFIYIFFIIIGAIILTALSFSFLDSLFETTSAAATVGLSSGITSYNMPLIGKIVLIFEMWIGRLEILPILVWIGASLSSKRWSSFYE